MQSRSEKPPIQPAVFILVAIVAAVVAISLKQGRLSVNNLLFFAVLIPSIIVHEVAHGIVSLWFGDDTAKRAGRLTANPLRHVDPWGTFILPGVLLLSGTGLAFGYAKPVPVNTAHMSRNKAMFVGLAGPATNIILALIAAFAIIFLYGGYANAYYDGHASELMLRLIVQFGIANVVLAAFNLIPIPPLDGSSVIERFLPQQYWAGYLKFRQYSMFILIALMLFAGTLLNYIFDPAIDLWWDLAL